MEVVRRVGPGRHITNLPGFYEIASFTYYCNIYIKFLAVLLFDVLILSSSVSMENLQYKYIQTVQQLAIIIFL